jgi:uncharacterized protein
MLATLTLIAWVLTASPRPPIDTLTLQTPTGNLFGTLIVPSGAGSFPLVVIIAGSGPTDRDGNSTLLPGAHNSLKLLAEGLAERGIASLRYDKRGIGASAKALRSEGSLLGMLAAERTLVDGYVSIAGAGRRIDRILREQLSAQLLAKAQPHAKLLLIEDMNHVFKRARGSRVAMAVVQ